jgi:hypothetical protein
MLALETGCAAACVRLMLCLVLCLRRWLTWLAGLTSPAIAQKTRRALLLRFPALSATHVLRQVSC